MTRFGTKNHGRLVKHIKLLLKQGEITCSEMQVHLHQVFQQISNA